MTARDLFLKCITANKPRHNPADYEIVIFNELSEYQSWSCTIESINIDHDRKTVTLIQGEVV